jgi:hypothetical protein
MGTGGSYLGVKRLGREADHSPPSSAEVKDCVELYIHSPIRLHGVVLSQKNSTGTALPLPFLHLRFKYSSQYPVLRHSQPILFPQYVRPSFTPCTAPYTRIQCLIKHNDMKTCWEVRRMAPRILSLIRWRWVRFTPRPLYRREKSP